MSYQTTGAGITANKPWHDNAIAAMAANTFDLRICFAILGMIAVPFIV
jgi:hypothetical protein